ncbi:glycosyl transferase group 1 [Novosphingobium nitrogenifigens DSM 19370]|uniref:Glycosyl transferase group 1 n=1 Tax=Novosphingobium nitrogenifigens DSM 19370 TaxID=983920 RepID=F1Z8I2_9SPHN|nr:glycosyl transferase group 1 [Novosphingobium nitrogenifigens DSM 19370]
MVMINDLSHAMGGASALAVEAALGLAARGHAVSFLSGDTPPHNGFGHPGILARGLGQGRLLTRGKLDAFTTGLWNRETIGMIRDHIATHDRPDTIYHLHGWSQILSPSIFAALAPVRDRLVISAHDFFLACPNGAFADLSTGAPCTRTPLSLSCWMAGCDRRGRAQKLWRMVRGAIQRMALVPDRCPPVLAIHGAMRPLLARGGIPETAIRVVPNPVVPWSATRIAAEDNREALFVGRLEATKGPDLALAAARAAGMPIRIVGDGAMRESLSAQYPEARFEGRCPPSRIAELARSARLLVMPSRYPEPFGLVAMEALRSGIPVVLPPSALLADDIVRQGAGQAVEPRDETAFAAILRELAADNARVRQMSEAAFTATGSLALDNTAWIDCLIEAYRDRLNSCRAGIWRTVDQEPSGRALPSMSASAGGV